MPTFLSAIPNTYQSIDNKILRSITRDLRGEGWLPHFGRWQIVRPGHKPKTRGSTVKKGTTRKWQHNDVQMLVTVETEPGPVNIAHARTADNYIRPIFWDKRSGVRISPQYDEKVFTMTFNVRSASRERLTSWSNLVRAKHQRADDRVQHDLEYSYGLETQSHLLLEQVYKMKEKIAGYDHTYDEYVSRHSSNSLSVVSAGDSQQLEYLEKQIEVVGYFAVNPEPSIEEVEDGLWEGTMAYVFTANLPHALVHEYPIMIHQQVLPWKFLETTSRDYRNVVVFNPLMRGFTEVNRDRSDLIHTISIPSMDQGYEAQVPDGYYPLVTAMMCITPDTDFLCNLHDLEDVELDRGVLKVLKDHYHMRMHQPYNTPFLITFHSGEFQMTENWVTVDHELNVRLNKPINLRNIYRVTLSVIIIPHRLSHHAMIPLKNNTRVKALLADTINNVDHDTLYNKQLINTYTLPNDFDDRFYLSNVLPNIKYGFDHGGGRSSNGYNGGTWYEQPYYHENYRKLYGRSIYGDNLYTDTTDMDYTGKGIDHPDHDVHEYDPDHPEFTDTRRRVGRAIVSRFTVMTSEIHAFTNGQTTHKPVTVEEEPILSIGEDNGNS